MPTTTRADWKNLPLPQKRTRLDISRTLLASHMERVRQGLLPQSQDDRWFMFYEHYRLYIHRSWSGHCIYIAYFRCEANLWMLTHADANRDPAQYTQTDDVSDAYAFAVLVSQLLDEPFGYVNPVLTADIQPSFYWYYSGRQFTHRIPQLETLSSALNNLLAILVFDSNCIWRGHFEACHALARELRSQNAGQDELDEFSRQVREVFGGAGSFNDYAPTQFDPVTKRVRPIAGMEDLAVASAAVYRAALALTSKADAP